MPSFFIRDKVCFVNYMDDHHDDSRLALWCACPPGMRDGLVKAQPDQYFVPPYVGFRGWIGVRLDREPDWDDVERPRRVSRRRAEETRRLPGTLTVSYPWLTPEWRNRFTQLT